MTNTQTSPEAGYFDKDRSAEIVNARMASGTDARLREVMEVMVRHLHAAVKEANLTDAEWMAGIQFLTATGQMCTDWRQETILLSDILGVSMLVDAISHGRAEHATPNTVLGPFYLADAPHYQNGSNICLDGKGEPLLVKGKVCDADGKPIAGAKVDAWQTNDEGFYDVQQKGIQPDWNLRGVFTTDENGEYWFSSVKPKFYPIPDDGPVGKLLTALGRHPNRPAHIHFIVTAPGFETVTTHIFAPDCPYLGEDPVFGVKQSLVAEFRKIDAPTDRASAGAGGANWEVKWNFILSPLP